MRYISAPQRSHNVLISPAGGVVSADFNGVIGRVASRAEAASAGGSGSDIEELCHARGTHSYDPGLAVTLQSSGNYRPAEQYTFYDLCINNGRILKTCIDMLRD